MTDQLAKRMSIEATWPLLIRNIGVSKQCLGRQAGRTEPEPIMAQVESAVDLESADPWPLTTRIMWSDVTDAGDFSSPGVLLGRAGRMSVSGWPGAHSERSDK